ncbi:MAG TPA: GNAT family N-acetyltransferase [Devosiaceae bacterium]|jgi:ribosomal protein S18 acetylase RimI-like enzyme
MTFDMAAAARQLDNPIWHALSGAHSDFAIVLGNVRRYVPEVAPFAAVAEPETGGFAELALAIPQGGGAALFTPQLVTAPPGMKVVVALELQQMVATEFRPYDRPREMAPLTAADVPAMLELVALTQPGPFGARTIELGGYLGIWDGGRLVGMSGERLRFDGFTEVSAVCVHPDYRGRGYAKALVSAVAETIARRGDMPFLHVLPDNRPAIATYEALGFRARRRLHLTRVQHRQT